MRSLLLSKRFQLNGIVILCLILGFACSRRDLKPTDGESIIKPPRTVILTSTTSPTMSYTDVPSLTPTKSVTPSPTNTKIFLPTSTPTIQETLESEKALEEIRRLLREEDCSSPCFWGIKPNHTTINEVKDFFLYLGHPLEKTLQEGDKEFYNSLIGLGDGMTVSVLLIVQYGYVTNIDTGIGLVNFRGPYLPRLWSAYSPESLLRKYGVPSSVQFFVEYPHEPGAQPGAAWYDMIIYFESANLIVRYREADTQEGEFLPVCPLIDNYSGVHIWLGEEPEFPPSKGYTLKEATSLTLEEFYNLLVTDPDSACFDLIEESFYP